MHELAQGAKRARVGEVIGQIEKDHDAGLGGGEFAASDKEGPGGVVRAGIAGGIQKKVVGQTGNGGPDVDGKADARCGIADSGESAGLIVRADADAGVPRGEEVVNAVGVGGHGGGYISDVYCR